MTKQRRFAIGCMIIIDRLYTMLITPPANFGVTSRRDNRVYLRRRLLAFLVHTFVGFTMQKALASGAPPQTPLGELTALPQTP